MPGKADYVTSILPGEHALTTYHDAKEQFLLVRLFIKHCLQNHGRAVIVSNDADFLRRKLSTRQVFRNNLDAGDVKFFTWSQVFSPAIRFKSFSKFYRALLDANSDKVARGVFYFVGDPPEKSLSNFGIQEEIERVLDKKRSGLEPIVLCIFARNRLASLRAKNLITLYKKHDAILLNESILKRAADGRET